ncbi:TPA: valine--tRNA ligase [Neisseria meningitidis]|jgi:valyl-tRNA synthetase (EC 6.1.1.9)|uniref:Valine--tRNA ligase n=3 Tax=Neisseria meningitidis TaxID=487 RepID=SYV_NEIMB|nr:valine--tRNA ligase [Neisseria meningitidis]Q9K1H7.1 RecName: Full=Valine--tRNA ligase; AltName: Full=Valyl-tRNA synthetase; Short=ValRS [Neisseria meningitidis MC58]AAF40631.1 valyl-tRNA synthetase [Neisseria meningitidis MC58]ADY94842.1 valyl-tRNA synthetase [Neisseria meningitidis H44/76]ARC08703.1 valine--tRNA ligase [Neisseria meningitidis]EFV64643.1 valyl-tRNA synthetase [Neisseria meningitidis H44/76]EGC63687.1 valyl-tRNA synthetase [Neisseria meningitidis CU385]
MLDKYNPAEIESKHYQNWEEQGYFQPDMDLTKPSFSIQLPPPNVTGTLHMGHAFNQTIMDGLTRYYRMKGCNTAWIPGTDHAGIATQIVVERQLAAQNVSRHDLGREKFLEKVWEWKEVSGGTITQQMRRVGCSADWTREYFTMDDVRAETVTEVFVRLYEQGLIYRGKRLVNWDPVLGTAVSDLEVESVEEQGSMWHIRYPLADNPAEAVIVATTRPETLLGDVAVAVNPEDERYTHLIGKELILPLTGRTIPVIADEYVEKDFGTGCVKITPAHDFNDYEVGKRHDTRLINVFNLEAKVLANAEVFNFKGEAQLGFALPEKYAGLDRFAARKQMVADLQEQGFLVEIKPHTLMTPKGDRTGSVIEPMLTSQWFVAMSATPNGGEPDSEFKGLSLADKAKKAVDSGAVRFIPENWVNTYNQWMNNIQDWCISRQLWWGHQIPAWYDNEGNVYVARNQEEAEKQAGKTGLTREEDVLDTWFSSALVPFSTLGWPSETDELKAFLPSNVLVTGYEIIFFWVARMIMMTTHFTGKVPFKDVYIHGIVRDHEGKKMSKSEGNVIDPVDLIDGIGLEKLLVKRTTGLRKPETAPKVEEATKKLFPEGIPSMGADALRFTMASYASLGRSVNFDFKRAEGYRNFCNKIWNATNFVLMNTENQDCGYGATAAEPRGYSFPDMWIVGRLNQTIEQVTQAYETYRFDLAAETLYSFVWNDYCDWYLELAKVQLQTGCASRQRATRHTLLRVLEAALRLLHPIIPFITEELWQTVAPMCDAKTADSIMLARFPEADSGEIVQTAFEQMTVLQDLIGAVRNLRGEMGIQPNVKAPLFVESTDDLADYLKYLPMMTRLTEAQQVAALPESEDAPVAVCNGARLMLKVEIDKAAETARLSKEAEKLQKALDKLNAKLSKPGYTEKAPAHLVEKDKADLAELEDKMAKVQNQLAKLKD